MARNKIVNVPDCVCKGCSQNWKGDCCAFCASHSPEEYEQRRDGKLNCSTLYMSRPKEGSPEISQKEM